MTTSLPIMYLLNDVIDYTDVIEINDTATIEESGSGSGSENVEDFFPAITKHKDDAILQDEIAGQMYSYRYNDTRVVLGTRKRDSLGAAVGIGTVAIGQYKCFAMNERQNKDILLQINVLSKLFLILVILNKFLNLC